MDRIKNNNLRNLSGAARTIQELKVRKNRGVQRFTVKRHQVQFPNFTSDTYFIIINFTTSKQYTQSVIKEFIYDLSIVSLL